MRETKKKKEGEEKRRHEFRKVMSQSTKKVKTLIVKERGGTGQRRAKKGKACKETGGHTKLRLKGGRAQGRKNRGRKGSNNLFRRG